MAVSLIKADALYAAFLTSPKGRTMRQIAVCGADQAALMLAHSAMAQRLRFVRMV